MRQKGQTSLLRDKLIDHNSIPKPKFSSPTDDELSDTRSHEEDQPRTRGEGGYDRYIDPKDDTVIADASFSTHLSLPSRPRMAKYNVVKLTVREKGVPKTAYQVLVGKDNNDVQVYARIVAYSSQAERMQFYYPAAPKGKGHARKDKCYGVHSGLPAKPLREFDYKHVPMLQTAKEEEDLKNAIMYIVQGVIEQAKQKRDGYKLTDLTDKAIRKSKHAAQKKKKRASMSSKYANIHDEEELVEMFEADSDVPDASVLGKVGIAKGNLSNGGYWIPVDVLEAAKEEALARGDGEDVWQQRTYDAWYLRYDDGIQEALAKAEAEALAKAEAEALAKAGEEALVKVEEDTRRVENPVETENQSLGQSIAKVRRLLAELNPGYVF
ncbi:hypothetical protein P7C71_g396, partial [Lecanoromycetidae sp. Uapishka_2]